MAGRKESAMAMEIIVPEKNKKAEKIAKTAAITAEANKAVDVLVLEMASLTVICDYFVICTGNSAPHLKSLADHIVEEVKKEMEIKPSSVQGDSGSRWIVVDFGSVIVHILSPEMREFYQIENMWGDAPRMLKFLPPVKKKRKKSE